MLERCLMLNSGYTAAYLLLAKLHTGSQTGRLLKHVAMYQPKNPEHQARYARWLRDHREYFRDILQNGIVRVKIERLRPQSKQLLERENYFRIIVYLDVSYILRSKS